MTKELLDLANTDNLTASIVRQYITGGAQASPEELAYLVTIAKNIKASPFLKEIYFIKYDEKTPAQIVVSRDFYRKRAQMNPLFKGIESGVIVTDLDGELAYRDGAVKLPTDTLLGGWAKVYVKDYVSPIKSSVMYDEYVQMKDVWENNRKTGEKEPKALWASKPLTMITKVAESQALRSAFPSEFSGSYAEEEIPEASELINKDRKDVTPAQGQIGNPVNQQGMYKQTSRQEVLEKQKMESIQKKGERQQAPTNQYAQQGLSTQNDRYPDVRSSQQGNGQAQQSQQPQYTGTQVSNEQQAQNNDEFNPNRFARDPQQSSQKNETFVNELQF
ncbi:phage recombination protein Bet [Lactococcus allomyrinae]|uniref:Phage recombination protein Bet n=1 Tax=Lactococcus allomyrinae TaxID=2419773 RepID=A0A387BCQ3_9LACT|nr:phage recombination protein Bet [Lactococcus allomyrinae]AYF99791.1 phage recombination protein Bet [Lactococcus allomyrinae]